MPNMVARGKELTCSAGGGAGRSGGRRLVGGCGCACVGAVQRLEWEAEERVCLLA
jgi:hypothetical protein